MKRATAVLLGLVLIVGLAFVLFRKRGNVPTDPIGNISVGDKTPKLIEDGLDVQNASLESRRSSPQPANADSASLAKRYTIRVIDGKTRNPVGGAIVRAATDSEINGTLGNEDREDTGWRDVGRIDRGLKGGFIVGKTNSDGVVICDGNSGSLILTAELEHSWGIAAAQDIQGQSAEIALYDDEPARAMVLDGHKKALAGAQLMVRPTTIGDGGTHEYESTSYTREDDGIALLPHIGWLLHSHSDHSYEVSVEALLISPVSLSIEAGQLGATPFVLVLPDVGQVTVKLIDESGSPYDQDALYMLSGKRHSEASDSAHEHLVASPIRVLSSRGTVTFGLVEVGLDLTLDARTGAPMRRTTEKTLGPKIASEKQLVELRLKSEVIDIKGSVKLAGGRSAAGASLHAIVRESGGRSEKVDVVTDANGSFVIHSSAQASNPLGLEMSTSDEDGSLLETHVNLPPSKRGQARDAGTLTLERHRPLLTGRLINEDGDGVGNVSILASALDWDDARQLATGEKTGLDVKCVSGADGRFQLRGETLQRAIELRLAAMPTNTYAEEAFVFPVGSEDVSVVLRSCGTVEGSVLLDDNVDPSSVLCSCRWPTSLGSRTNIKGRDRNLLAKDGRVVFHFDRIPSGVVTVEFALVAAKTPIKIIAGIAVPKGGATSTDPRLINIDLRGALHGLCLALTDEDRNHIGTGEIWWCKAGDHNRWSKKKVSGNQCCVTPEELPIDVVALSPGFQTTVVYGVTGDRAIQLTKCVCVTVTVDRQRVTNTSDLLCVLTPGPTLAKSRVGPAFLYRCVQHFDESGTARCELPTTGSYTLHLTGAGQNGKPESLDGADGILIEDLPDLSKDLALQITDPAVYLAIQRLRK